MDDEEDMENPVKDSERNWNRVIGAATKAGYREGIEEGKQSVFQQGFDVGYEDGFRTAFSLGKYKGLATGLNCDLNNPSPVNDILDKTRRGACYICVKESNKSTSNENDFLEPPIQEVRNEQKLHSENAIRTLYQHFQEISNDQGLFFDHFIA